MQLISSARFFPELNSVSHVINRNGISQEESVLPCPTFQIPRQYVFRHGIGSKEALPIVKLIEQFASDFYRLQVINGKFKTNRLFQFESPDDRMISRNKKSV